MKFGCRTYNLLVIIFAQIIANPDIKKDYYQQLCFLIVRLLCTLITLLSWAKNVAKCMTSLINKMILKVSLSHLKTYR